MITVLTLERVSLAADRPGSVPPLMNWCHLHISHKHCTSPGPHHTQWTVVLMINNDTRCASYHQCYHGNSIFHLPGCHLESCQTAKYGKDILNHAQRQKSKNFIIAVITLNFDPDLWKVNSEQPCQISWKLDFYRIYSRISRSRV